MDTKAQTLPAETHAKEPSSLLPITNLTDMPTFNKPTRKYYTISKEDSPDGLIRHKDHSGQVHHFGGLEGILTSIDLVKDEYEGQIQMKWQFKFEDRDHSQVDILQIGEGASAARGLIISMVSCPGEIGWVSLSPYRKEYEGSTYTNLYVKINREEVEWDEQVIDNLPGVQAEEYKGREFIDDSARRKYVRQLARRVMDNQMAGRMVHDEDKMVTPENPPQIPQDHSSGASVDKQSNQKPKEQPQQANGMQQAEKLYGQPGKKPEQDVNMDGWEKDIDDDLPF
jgi:hypothetical protein